MFDLPPPDRNNMHLVYYARTREISYQPHEQAAIVRDDITRLNNNQRHVYHDSVETQRTQLIFLDGPRGTENIFVNKLILAKVKSEGKISVVMTSSDIAAM